MSIIKELTEHSILFLYSSDFYSKSYALNTIIKEFQEKHNGSYLLITARDFVTEIILVLEIVKRSYLTKGIKAQQRNL